MVLPSAVRWDFWKQGCILRLYSGSEWQVTNGNLVELKSKLKAAQHAYDQAVASFDELSRKVVNSSNGTPPPDGIQAIRNAASQEQVAFTRYRTALQAYLDYVLGGVGSVSTGSSREPP